MVDAVNSRLLIVEDERNVALTLIERLRKEGFDVAWAENVEAAKLEISRRKFDLALLDVGLPDGSGFEVASEMRRSRPATAIVFLTAFGSPEERVRGLELGAEDYVVKPFHLKELLLRVKNALKRARLLARAIGEEISELQIGKAYVSFSRFEVEADGKIHSLTHKEGALLKLLIEKKNKVVSRDEILDQVWSESEFPTSRTVDNFIMRLRRLVEANPEDPRLIKSIRGIGYQLTL